MTRKADSPLNHPESVELTENAVSQSSRRKNLTRLLSCILAATAPAIVTQTAFARGRGGSRGGRGGKRPRGDRGGKRPRDRGGRGPRRPPNRLGNRQIRQFVMQCRQQFQACMIRARQGIGGLF